MHVQGHQSKSESGTAQSGGHVPQEKFEITHFEICSFGLEYCVNGASYLANYLAVFNDKTGQ